MDRLLLSTLLDRWRPETHSFHLPCGEMTVSLQDTAMILGLPLEGLPVSGIIHSAGWRDMVELHIGVRPPDVDERDASRKSSRVNRVWLRQHFTVCPQGAAEAVVERHAHVWQWHFVATFLVPDVAGNTVSWMVLPLLGQDWDNIRGYSWGSTVLAWLYRQLCDACRRSGRVANLGGCAYLVHIWIWERLPVGRPHCGPVEVHTIFLFFIHANYYS
jgi:hypothetical protein